MPTPPGSSVSADCWGCPQGGTQGDRQGLGGSGKTQVAIWSPPPQAPPICQAPTLLLSLSLPSATHHHPPPQLSFLPPFFHAPFTFPLPFPPSLAWPAHPIPCMRLLQGCTLHQGCEQPRAPCRILFSTNTSCRWFWNLCLEFPNPSHQQGLADTLLFPNL